MDAYQEALPWRGRACAALAVLSLTAVGAVVWQHAQPRIDLDAEPHATSSFLAAYSRADEATAERVASPLYRDEWARWGLSVQERVDMAPRRSMADGRPAPWVDFTYLGGARDGHGFQHFLYAAAPVCAVDCHGYAVWRVDAEPDGRVIWAEMVWMFGDQVKNLVTSTDSRDLPRGMTSAAFAAGRSQLALAVMSSTGSEGYYELVMGKSAHTIAFFAIGPDGDVRPGAWSYGRPHPALAEYGSRPVVPIQHLPMGEELLRGQYMESLP